MGEIRNREFFTCDAAELAKNLVGKVLCHKVGKGKDAFVIKVRILTTEAYLEKESFTDANRVKESNSQELAGGHIHFHNAAEGRRRMDIVANEAGITQSVLIAECDMYDGPQKTLWALDADDKKYDGLDLVTSDEIWLEDDGVIVELKEATQRKNIADASLLRFSARSFTFK